MTPEAIRRIIEHIPIRYDAGTPQHIKSARSMQLFRLQ